MFVWLYIGASEKRSVFAYAVQTMLKNQATTFLFLWVYKKHPLASCVVHSHKNEKKSLFVIKASWERTIQFTEIAPAVSLCVVFLPVFFCSLEN